MNIDPLISLEVLCDDVFTIKLDQQYTEFQNNGKQILRGYRNHHTFMWVVLLLNTAHKDLDTTKPQNIPTQAIKPVLARYYHSALFFPTNTSLRSVINKF